MNVSSAVLRAGMLGVLVATAGCASTLSVLSGVPVVDRLRPWLVTDVSGSWNDSDSRETANAVITQFMRDGWARDFARQRAGAAPTVIVGTIADHTGGRVQTVPLVRALESALVSSESVRIVAAAREREELRGERSDQARNASRDTRAPQGVETGADYMVQGDISVFEDARASVRTVAYQVDLTLLDLATGRKILFASHSVKKLVSR